MNAADRLAKREAAIRHYLDAKGKDAPTAAKYAAAAARWELLKLQQSRRQTTPADDTRLRELEHVVQYIGQLMGLGETIIDRNGFLIGDPARIVYKNWFDHIEDWF